MAKAATKALHRPKGTVMALLDIVIGPDPIFRKKAVPFEVIDDTAKAFADDLLHTMYENRGIGIAANMVGEAKRLIIVDIQQDGRRDPLICFNPRIEWLSNEQALNEEASLSFPGISAEIKRPTGIKLSYQDENGTDHSLEANGWLATVIQHEMDYLDGRTYLDHLSKMKRDRLLKKMQKYLKDTSASSCCSDPNCSNNS